MIKVRPSRSARKKRVFIVDDHAVFRAGLRRLLDKGDFQVCGEAGNAAEAFDRLPSAKPDIILMDLSLGGTNGIELTRQLHGSYPAVPILVVSTHEEALYATQAIKAGARGYLVKTERPQRLMEAMAHVVEGRLHVSATVVSDLIHRTPDAMDGQSPAERLSQREMQVFRLIGQGRGTRQIAEQLQLSVKTIESYRAHIKEKMNYETSYQLVRAAICWSQQEKTGIDGI